ncbi:MAG TPA: cyclopropane-fatty-acyl-phospholipid synthase family protein [Solirubrobacteraceae bacterium]|nr:cyclopropane-fatty-acyl-phospholipid synthase family protein [Solirubrobacteraceae bacterium]
MFSTTAPLRRELAAAFPDRPFAVRFWDGTELPATTDNGAPTFLVNSPKALAHVVRAPGELGVGRAYAHGLIDADDLDAGMLVFDTFEPPDLKLPQLTRLGVALLRAAGLTLPPKRPGTELRLRGERHTITRDKAAVRHHYNVGNDFFKLFLDETMTYSCAYWRDGAATLEEAQFAKRELVCRKLALQPDERVLDVGCGWGSFVIHAAQEHGVSALGVTISDRQAELAQQRVIEAGVADKVEIRVADYREVADEPFDAIASIGMVEHVGDERIDLYASRLHELLKPGGRLLNHGIAKLMDFDTTDEGPFSERFVFPDGVPLPLSRIELALERTGLVTRHVEGLQQDYAETLRHWISRLDDHYDEALALVGIERLRVWRLYLRAARQGFETGWASIYQVLADKPAR